MSLLDQKANEVLGYMKADTDELNPDVPDVAGLAIMTLLMVASILVGCIQIWQGCGSPPLMATENLKNDTLLTRMQLRRLIRIKAKEQPRADRREFRIKLEDAVHKMGENLTVEEMTKLFEEVDEKKKEGDTA